MVTIRTDERSIDLLEDRVAEREASESAEAYLDARLRLARALRRVAATGTYRRHGCASLVEFAVRLRVPVAEARTIVDLGAVLDLAVPAGAAVSATEPATTRAPPDETGRPWDLAAAGPPFDPTRVAQTPSDGVVDGSGGELGKAPHVVEAGGDSVPESGPPRTTPSVEECVRAGLIPVENAALASRVLAVPDLVRPGEDWIGWAASLPTPAFRRRVNARLEEAAQRTRALVALHFVVTEKARDGFRRARVVASREAGTRLSEGQTFALVVDRYLDAFDELRRGTGTRRVGPTAEARGERYVPAVVRREVLERSGDRCEVPSCPHDTFLEMAHVESHAAGGDREAANLLRLCTAHHTQFDAGLFGFAGWRREDGAAAAVSAGGTELASDGAPPRGGRCAGGADARVRPVFVDAEGEEIRSAGGVGGSHDAQSTFAPSAARGTGVASVPCGAHQGDLPSALNATAADDGTALESREPAEDDRGAPSPNAGETFGALDDADGEGARSRRSRRGEHEQPVHVAERPPPYGLPPSDVRPGYATAPV